MAPTEQIRIPTVSIAACISPEGSEVCHGGEWESGVQHVSVGGPTGSSLPVHEQVRAGTWLLLSGIPAAREMLGCPSCGGDTHLSALPTRVEGGVKGGD